MTKFSVCDINQIRGYVMLIDKDRIFVGDIYKKTSENATKLIKKDQIVILVFDFYVPLSKLEFSNDLAKLDLQMPLRKNEGRFPEYYLETYKNDCNLYFVSNLKNKFKEKGCIDFYSLKVLSEEYIFSDVSF